MQTAADIVNSVMKKLVELCVEGAKVLDLCVEGDKLLEQGTGAVYNKAVKGVKVSKGVSCILFFRLSLLTDVIIFSSFPPLLSRPPLYTSRARHPHIPSHLHPAMASLPRQASRSQRACR